MPCDGNADCAHGGKSFSGWIDGECDDRYLDEAPAKKKMKRRKFASSDRTRWIRVLCGVVW